MSRLLSSRHFVPNIACYRLILLVPEKPPPLLMRATHSWHGKISAVCHLPLTIHVRPGRLYHAANVMLYPKYLPIKGSRVALLVNESRGCCKNPLSDLAYLSTSAGSHVLAVFPNGLQPTRLTRAQQPVHRVALR